VRGARLLDFPPDTLDATMGCRGFVSMFLRIRCSRPSANLSLTVCLGWPVSIIGHPLAAAIKAL
jgi:hypothetical protein